DRRAGAIPDDWRINVVPEQLLEPPFALRHDPAENEGAFTICGHLHPVASIQGRAKTGVRLRCFWFSSAVAVLPAFGSFTGGSSIRPGPEDAVFVITPEGVFPLRRPVKSPF
ncbi:MAG: DEAD/DEAH box helicase, partial [Planctomycetota bacterium]|nr:DEAD/DEAH box helicase [Planctomycetota bacterium]